MVVAAIDNGDGNCGGAVVMVLWCWRCGVGYGYRVSVVASDDSVGGGGT